MVFERNEADVVALASGGERRSTSLISLKKGIAADEKNNIVATEKHIIVFIEIILDSFLNNLNF